MALIYHASPTPSQLLPRPEGSFFLRVFVKNLGLDHTVGVAMVSHILSRWLRGTQTDAVTIALALFSTSQATHAGPKSQPHAHDGPQGQRGHEHGHGHGHRSPGHGHDPKDIDQLLRNNKRWVATLASRGHYRY